jgi:hypothetical protein
MKPHNLSHTCFISYGLFLPKKLFSIVMYISLFKLIYITIEFFFSNIQGTCVGRVDGLNADYFALRKVRINLVVLVKELKSFNFLILMSLRVSNGEPELEGARQPPSYILDSLNKFLKILINILGSNHSIRSYMCPLRPLLYF